MFVNPTLPANREAMQLSTAEINPNSAMLGQKQKRTKEG